MCIACGCHLVYKLERGQAWSGCAAGSPRSTLCCRKALYTLTTSNCHQHFLTLCSGRESWPGSPLRDPEGGFLSSPPLAWCHGSIPGLSHLQIYFLPLCGFPKCKIRGSAMEKLFGIFTHVQTSTEQGVIDSLSEISNQWTAPIQRDPGISWETLPGHKSRVFQIKSTFFVTRFLCSGIKKWILISLMIQPISFPHWSKSCHRFHSRLF